jgi:hypothetical protein
MRAKRLLVGAALVTSIAACGEDGAPFIPTTTPSFDGGHTLGGGAGAGAPTTTTQMDTTQRGGHTLGGGA